MATDPPGRLREVGRVVIDVLAYATVVVPAALIVALLGGVGTGGGLVGAKIALFVIGWAMVMLGTVRLWPTPSDVDPDGSGAPSGAPAPIRGETRIESVAAALPPKRWTMDPTYRLSPATKLFVSGLLVLACSLLLETVFAVR